MYTCVYSIPPLLQGDAFQDSQWMPENMNSTNQIYTMFFPGHTNLCLSLTFKLGTVRH